jgi:hypothetical protein
MDLWDYDVRSHPDTPARFSNLTLLCSHYEAFLSRERIQERIETEKTVFVIRRESSLEETMRQFLRRLEAVLQADVDGLPIPAPRIPLMDRSMDSFPPDTE